MTHPIPAVTIEAKALKAALIRAAKVIDNRTKIPILACVRLSWSAEGLSVEATDLDLWIEIAIPAAAPVAEPGQACVEAKTLLAMLRKADKTASLAALSRSGDYLTVELGPARYELSLLDAEDADRFPAPDLGCAGAPMAQMTFAPGEMARLFADTVHAAGREETRSYLNGVYLHAAPDGDDRAILRAVATDGHRLALADAGAAEGAWGVIAPTKAAAILAKVDAAAEMAAHQTGVAVKAGDLTLKAKAVEGDYPDYTRVIPHFARPKTERSLTVDAAALAKALIRTSKISKAHCVAARLALGEDGVEVSVAGEDAKAVEAVEGQAVGEMVAGFNAKYLAEALGRIEGEAVLRFADPAAPMRLSPVDDPSRVFVVMPMRV